MLGNFAAGFLMLSAVPPSGPPIVWKWEKETEGCALRQELGVEGFFLAFGRTPGSDQTSVTFQDRRAAVKRRKPAAGAIVKLHPGGRTATDGYLAPGDAPKSRKITVRVNDQKFMEALSLATTITLSHDLFGELTVPIRSSAAAVQALRNCEDRKMREWGIDPIAWRALQSRPIPFQRPAEWFTEYDYPLMAGVYGIEASLIARLEVGSDGTVKKCTVLNPGFVTVFRDAACSGLTRNGRFHPALNSQGQPVAAPFVVLIRFRMGE